MKKFKNGLPITLMFSSIALLLVLQAFWLRSTYNKASDDLRKETNLIFRNTLYAMRDSVMQRSIEALPGDSSGRYLRLHSSDPFPPREDGDSVFTHFRRHEREQSGRIQVFMSSDESDSAGQRNSAARVFRNRGQANFFLRFGQDTLKVDSVKINFKFALTAAGIDLPFEVFHVKRGEKVPAKAGSLVSEPVRLNPMVRYAFALSNVQGKIIREIFPQILFSVFLTLLTAGSFYIMYRSMVAQQKIAELKNDFISNVTHELKTPITTVGVALEALRNFKGLENPQLTREYLDIAQNELNRLTILTDKVLKTAIFEENGVTYQSEKVDIGKLLDQIFGSMKLVFEKSQANVTFNKEGNDFTVLGGADHLTNIFYNLIDNALKYSPGKPEISVSIRHITNKVVVSIQDAGQGIAPEFHKKIFEKFFRVPTGDVHDVKGYGLGLSYVADVVLRHHGTIVVDSNLGKGSRFEVTLPSA